MGYLLLLCHLNSEIVLTVPLFPYDNLTHWVQIGMDNVFSSLTDSEVQLAESRRVF